MSEPMTADQAIESLDNAHMIVYTAAPEDVLLQVSPLIDKAQDFIRTQSARIAELEEAARLLQDHALTEQKRADALDAIIRTKLDRIASLELAVRWRSCKDEPPENQRAAARYQGHDWFPASYDSGIWRDDFGDRIPPPNEWRSIT